MGWQSEILRYFSWLLGRTGVKKTLHLFELVCNIYMQTKWENASKDMYKDKKNLA